MLVDLKPTGQHYMQDLFAAGGMHAVLYELRELLHLDCKTVTGETLGQRLAHPPAYVDRGVHVVQALHQAAGDDRVTGLVADLSHVGLGLAQIEEVRDAVAAFRASGKPTIAFADSFGEVMPANGAYYLASAFDEIYVQPSGDVGLTGLQLTSTFLRGTLDKLGVVPEFAQRYEFKNAMNTFTHTEFTPDHRLAMEELAGSISATMCS